MAKTKPNCPAGKRQVEASVSYRITAMLVIRSKLDHYQNPEISFRSCGLLYYIIRLCSHHIYNYNCPSLSGFVHI
jgi:hypothetical protein